MPSAVPRHHDLVLDRIVPTAVEDLWHGWTDAATLKRWFTPAPWSTTDAEVDAVPGGIFRTVMEGPEGERAEGAGCVLEAVPNRRFVWSSALGPGFVPVDAAVDGFHFTAIVAFEPVDGGTRVRTIARHATAADAAAHAEMGFEAGWGAALDQLVALFA